MNICADGLPLILSVCNVLARTLCKRYDCVVAEGLSVEYPMLLHDIQGQSKPVHSSRSQKCRWHDSRATLKGETLKAWEATDAQWSSVSHRHNSRVEICIYGYTSSLDERLLISRSPVSALDIANRSESHSHDNGLLRLFRLQCPG